MVQQIVTLCDVCYDEDKTSPAQGHIVSVAGGTWHLELCEAHRVALIDPLADVAERLGQAVKPGAPKAATSSSSKPGGLKGSNHPTAEPCLLCGHYTPTIAALLMHLRVKHQANVEAVYGAACPLCGRESSNASGLGGHVSRSHPEVTAAEGYASVPEAFRYASEHGDPQGIVAKVLANHGLAALPRRVKR